MITFNIITLFPELFKAHLENLPFKRAGDLGITKINLIQLRDFAIDKRGTVDDKPFGGGVGMILMIEPIYYALEKVNSGGRIVLLSPRGKKLNQEIVKNLSKEKEITIICGRYEGIDARVEENLATDVISIGDYVLSGGELPALVLMEAIVRLLPNVLEKKNATKIESFEKGYLEYPQYTRPEDFRGMKVPKVLLSGNHKEIEKWRKQNSKKV